MFFSRYDKDTRLDFSSTLRDEDAWTASTFKRLGISGNIAALAVEPFSGLLALGTDRGSVHLFGSLSVSLELSVPGSPYRRIRFINFAQSLGKLVVVDSRDNLHIYDLKDDSGKPSRVHSQQISRPVNAIAVSPSHAHAFIALNNGQCITFDLDRHCLSPYTLPNVWAQHEDRNGIFRARSVGAEPVLTDILVHPRDLNLLLLAFEGGVVLWDITKREACRIYELKKMTQSIKEVDSRSVTCLAVHPSGNIFAAGHLDGAISFWSLEDPSNPLAVRTLPAIGRDQNTVEPREPIFKLAWSSFPRMDECKHLLIGRAADNVTALPRLLGPTLDYAGGETVLTVLGGTLASDPDGVSILQFPILHIPDTPNPTPELAELNRALSVESLTPLGITHYESRFPVQDILLLPRESPHFAAARDPIAILLLSKRPGDRALSSVLEAMEFPPPIESLGSSTDSPDLNHLSTDRDTATGFNVRYPTPSPLVPRLRLPSMIWTGRDNICGAIFLAVERGNFSRLIRHWVEHGAQEEEEGLSPLRRVPFRAGSAFPDTERKDGMPSRMGRLDIHHIMVSHHSDLTVWFSDMSPQLLTSSSPLRFEYPQPLPHLALNIGSILREPTLGSIFSGALDVLTIQSLHLTTDSLECLIALNVGVVLVFRFVAEGGKRDAGIFGDISLDLDSPQSIVVPLSDLGRGLHDAFQPVCLIDARRGRITRLATSDVGFHAVAYADGSLIILYMRDCRVMFPLDVADKKAKKAANPDVVRVLEWTVSRIANGPDIAALHLIVVHDSGAARVFNLKLDGDGVWNIHSATKNPFKTSVSHPIISFVINPDGSDTKPTPEALQTLPTEDPRRASLSKAPTSPNLRSLWILASSKECRCFVDVTGERVARVDWASPVKHVEMVSRTGRRAIVAFTETRNALVYSVPLLQLLHTFRLPDGPSRLGEVSGDGLGDYIEVFPAPAADYPYPVTVSTLFEGRRPLPPLVRFKDLRPLPLQPVPLSVEGSYTSWIWGPKVFSGREIDASLAGPDRPPPKVAEAPPTSAPPASTGGISAGPSKTVPNLSYTSDLYSRLTNAVSQRGEMLGGLEDSFQSLENSTRDLAGEAKRLARNNGAKRFFF